MKRRHQAILVPFLAVTSLGISGAEPIIPGLQGDHSLDAQQTGEVLVSELRCAACHEGIDNRHMKMAPDLSQTASRLRPEYLRKFIANPAEIHAGTTMPDVFGSKSVEEREKLASALAAYLASFVEDREAETPLGAGSVDEGAGLYHTVGCVVCHSPRDAAGNELSTEDTISLSHLPGKHQPGALEHFLHQPLKFRPSGRMPDMKLTREEAASLAAYLEGNPPPASDSISPDPDLMEAGRQAFQQYNCAACHQLDGQDELKPLPGPSLPDLNLDDGCLSDKPGAAPDFHLDTSQRESIRLALAVTGNALSPADRIKIHLTRLNCIACHVRDDFGGVSDRLNGYFHSTEEALGNESRLPPPLTLIGAKLRPEWMNKVLYDGESVRPYMKTRMPQYGKRALAGLTELFQEVDQVEPVEMTEPDRESGPMFRNGGHLLLGDKGLNCIACHNHNGKESPGLKGLDLMTSYQRLQPGWFYHYMKNPATFRPGIIMPNYWPDGQAVNTGILDGDTHLQLSALWHYFSLGRSARDPSGLRSTPSILEVTDRPRTYRGRSQVAGYRGIAVGFPGGLNYAFNAQNGALSAIWEGEFVSVGWQGQGAGNFNPRSRPIQLAQDVAFLPNLDPREPWPLRPQTSKENPVNPDPLYPKNHGYAFQGYSIGEESIPTFRYRCGEVEIEDRTEVSQGSLSRTFRFTTESPQTLWFRALTGQIETVSKTSFQTPNLRVTIEPATTHLRPFSENERELIVELPLQPAESTFTIRYELLR